MTGYLYRGSPDLEDINAAILAARVPSARWPRKVQHGASGYRNGCRCEVCTAAKSQQNAKTNAAHPGR